MLDQFLLLSYRKDQEKTASRQLIDKMKQLPLGELAKMASGEKRAFSSPDECASRSWVAQFQGTPMFDQAVDIEKQLLQMDAEDQATRGAERDENNARWDARDALNLKRRMLELDLAVHAAGGGPEAQEEKGVQMLEQAQAQERAEGEGGEPHEQAEDQAIQQFRQAQSQEAAAKAQEQSAQGGPPAAQKPKEEKPKGMSVEVKQASSHVADILKVSPGANRDALHPERSQGGGAVGDYSLDPSLTVTEGKQASLKLASAIEVGKFLAGLEKTAISHGRIVDAVRRAPEGRLERAFEHGVDMLGKAKKGKLIDQADTLATAASTRLAGGDWKRGLTNLKALRKFSTGIEKESADQAETARVRAEVAKKYPRLELDKKAEAHGPIVPLPALIGAVAGSQKAHAAGDNSVAGAVHGGLGAGAGTLLGALTGRAISRYAGLHPALGGLAAEAAGGALGGTLGYKAMTHSYQPKEKKAFLGALAKAAPGVMNGVKNVAVGAKNLATTAHAAGGMGQVAKSFGNVATQFAQKNPLAAAGIAGGAGLLAGRALTPSRQQG